MVISRQFPEEIDYSRRGFVGLFQGQGPKKMADPVPKDDDHREVGASPTSSA